MIDFRYHVVSLVAVFIALAVGIALGAGPLREGISDTLEGEVSQLRTERTELRSELEAARGGAAAKDEALGVVGDRAAAGTLTDLRIAVVVLPGADRNLLARAEDGIESAGGQVVLTAEIDEQWESGEVLEQATAVADELADGLDLPDPRTGDGPTLPTVLAAAVAGADAPWATGTWLAAGERLEREGYVDLTWRERAGAEVSDRRPPDAVLVVSGGLSAAALEGAPDDPAAEATGTALEARLALVDALAELDTPAVVAGEGTEAGALQPGAGLDPLVGAVREARDLRPVVSTVDNLESAAGQLAATLALAWEIGEESGHYGLGAQADAPMPAPPPVRFSASQVSPDQAEVTGPVPDDAVATDPGTEGAGASSEGAGTDTSGGAGSDGAGDEADAGGAGDGAGTDGADAGATTPAPPDDATATGTGR